MVKAIITDLDRTLLRTDKSISEYTLNVLKKCKDKGVLVFAATARPERTIKEFRTLVDFEATVTLNGAAVNYRDSVTKNSMPKETALLVAKRLYDFPGTVISIETDEGLFSNVDIPEWEPLVYPDLSMAPIPEWVNKILVSSDMCDLGNFIGDILPDSVYCSKANGFLFQIMSKEATKWNGIKSLLEHYGLSSSEIVYFGDDFDDIESIQNAGTGVAVSNSIPEVLAVSKYVTLSNDEDGVARFLEKEVLLK